MSAKSTWVPVLTSQAGLCLTVQNWQEAQLTSAVYYLDELLIKPGKELLYELKSLADYLNWPGQLILNASKLKANREGIITIISPYDGSKIRIDYSEFINLIHHLKPDLVLLPPNFSKINPDLYATWPDNIMPLVEANEAKLVTFPVTLGIYYNFYECIPTRFTSFVKLQSVISYVQGDLDFAQIQQLSDLGIEYIETNQPAQLGFNGVTYGKNAEINLHEPAHAQDFELLDSNCACSTCTNGLTKAYLHHLFLHTPLLCQRFLIQHNACYVQDSLRK